jgi:cytochrome oxidase Cu insertion factor (SCO1/SenC/PrrC family)
MEVYVVTVTVDENPDTTEVLGVYQKDSLLSKVQCLSDFDKATVRLLEKYPNAEKVCMMPTIQIVK